MLNAEVRLLWAVHFQDAGDGADVWSSQVYVYFFVVDVLVSHEQVFDHARHELVSRPLEDFWHVEVSCSGNIANSIPHGDVPQELVQVLFQLSQSVFVAEVQPVKSLWHIKQHHLLLFLDQKLLNYKVKLGVLRRFANYNLVLNHSPMQQF